VMVLLEHQQQRGAVQATAVPKSTIT
jgi:hypothetical protein